MDYSKYMSQGGGGKSGGSPGGDYKQYMDYSKYMSQGSGGKSGGSPGGDYKQYMDYSKYMSQGSSKNDSATNSNLVATNSKTGGDYQKYLKKYMPDVKNWSIQDEVRDAFVKRYAGKHMKQKNASISLSASNEAEVASAQVPTETTPAIGNISLDANAVNETALLAATEPHTTMKALLFLAAALPSAGLAIKLSAGKFSRQHSVYEPLLDLPLLRKF